MKQTAVEWLESQILEGSINIENGEMYIKLPKDALKKAKEMEKEQIIEANNRGWKVARENIFEPAEQYYNETFKLC
jgi:hypothetical protein